MLINSDELRIAIAKMTPKSRMKTNRQDGMCIMADRIYAELDRLEQEARDRDIDANEPVTIRDYSGTSNAKARLEVNDERD